MNDLPMSGCDWERFLERLVFLFVMLFCLWVHLGGKPSERATDTSDSFVHSLHMIKAGSKHTIGIIIITISSHSSFQMFSHLSEYPMHICLLLIVSLQLHICLHRSGSTSVLFHRNLSPSNLQPSVSTYTCFISPTPVISCIPQHEYGRRCYTAWTWEWLSCLYLFTLADAV